MNPIKTERFDGVYGAPKNYTGDEIGGLPYFRERSNSLDTNVIFSVWKPTVIERAAIAAGANILVGQVSEPIRPMSVQITDLKEVLEENA